MRRDSMATTRSQVFLTMSINKVEHSLPSGIAMGCQRRPGAPFQPIHSQMGLLAPSLVPTSFGIARVSY